MNELNQVEIAQRLFSSIDVIVDRKLEKVEFNTTITAGVVEPNTDGSYKLEYQDILFDAYPINANVYNKEDRVSVLIPNNDMREKKYILGLVYRAPEGSPLQTMWAQDLDNFNESILNILELLVNDNTEAARAQIQRLKEEK